MNPAHRSCLLAAVLLVLCSIGAMEPSATPPAAPNLADLAPAITPTARLDISWWAERHTRIVDAVRAHTDAQLLLLGDSITQNYDKANPPDEDFLPIWKQFYEPRRALNLGFSGDTTANVLWRITHGEIDGLRPRVAIILIGTNNTGHAHQTAEQTEAGIDNIIATLSQRLPQTRLLLLGILPSDISPEKTAADQAVNQYLSVRYGKNTGRNANLGVNQEPRVTFLGISSVFMTSPGVLNTAIFYDPRLPTPGKPLHPDTAGQRRMAEAIEPTLAKLMADTPRTAKDPPGNPSANRQPGHSY
ncbi:GDSL-type esterase/lipase family protein [Edaphobacter aggregans]|uniref:GDSL-type esterase/lipase family protein n=1 Tax=Edaphobacter aggregans TaxID=570835 RepID=UPI000B1F2E9E|nr:GDSL-type esterase/lipase family protein [Edaphobacter aggregans]